MDMPSAFPPGTEITFPSLSVCVCAGGSSVCFCAASVFGCAFSASCCARTAVGAAAKTTSNIKQTILKNSPPRRGGVARSAGVVSPAKSACRSDHPVCAASVASHLFIVAQPLLLCEEGNVGATFVWVLISSLLDCEGRQSIWRRRRRPERSGCTPRNAPARTCSRRDTGRTEWQGSCAQY